MTMLTDLDRRLGSVLETDGPQAVPPGLIEAALAEARAIEQRRPFMRVIDHLAWPPLVGSWSPAATRRLTITTLLALLMLAAIGAAALVGTSRPLRVLSEGQRAYVWLDDTAHLFVGDRATSHSLTPGRGGGACPVLIAGTTAVARLGFTGWDLVDVATGTPVASIDFNIAGSEVWSPDARRLGIFDSAGRVGIATLDDLEAPRIDWYAAPGFGSVEWSLDGRRMAIASVLDRQVVVEVLDVVAGVRREVYRQQLDSNAASGDAGLSYLRWGSDGATIALQIVDGREPTTTGLLDIDTGDVTPLHQLGGSRGAGPFLDGEGELARDGSSFALVTSPTEILIFDSGGGTVGTVATGQRARDLAWSAAGDRLAFREGDALVVVAADGTGRRTAAVGPRLAFGWDGSEPELIVASAAAGGVVVQRYEADKLTPVARRDSPSGAGVPPPTTRRPLDGQEAPICLQLDEFRPSPLGSEP